MGKIELRESFRGLSGTVHVDPSLSWRDSMALQQTADATRDVAGAVGLARRAIRALEYEIGLRLDAQTAKLERQVDLLADIAESLRTPARVRAAERVVSTAELLRRGRYARALEAAEQAVRDDPNNADAFTAVAWAQMGLGELHLAREAFSEAVVAADGDDKSRARRALARLTFALDDALAAFEILEAPVIECSAGEQAAVRYDRAVYLADTGDVANASKELLESARSDARYFRAALEDPQIISVELHRLAQSELERRETELEDAYRALGPTLDGAVRMVEEHETIIRQLIEPSRQDAIIAVGDVLGSVRNARESIDTEHERARASLSGFPVAELQERVEEVESRARQLVRDLELRLERERAGLAQAQAGNTLETEALRIAKETGAIPYIMKDGSWEIRFGKRGRKHIRLWLDDAGGIQRSEA